MSCFCSIKYKNLNDIFNPTFWFVHYLTQNWVKPTQVWVILQSRRRASAAVIVPVKLRLLQLSKPTPIGVIWKPFLNVSLLRLILISSSSQGRSSRWPGSTHANSSSHAKHCRRSQHLQRTSRISLCVLQKRYKSCHCGISSKGTLLYLKSAYLYRKWSV